MQTWDESICHASWCHPISANCPFHSVPVESRPRFRQMPYTHAPRMSFQILLPGTFSNCPLSVDTKTPVLLPFHRAIYHSIVPSALDAPSRANPDRLAAIPKSASPQMPGSFHREHCAYRNCATFQSPADPPRDLDCPGL